MFNSRIAYLCFAIILFSGCANTIYLPDRPAANRMSYLVDLGHHTRLAFGLPNGEFIEYGYGEWQWYANMENQWWRVPAALFWPTQGTLGRREWSSPGAEVRLLQEYDGLIVLEIPAESSKVDALVAKLARDFEHRSGKLVRNTVYRLDFVPYDSPYWLFNNSNHAIKEWLQALGYEVTGSGVFAQWKYQE